MSLSALLADTAHAATTGKGRVSGRKCTILGTPHNDHIVGTSRSDVICGRGGNDFISGRGGHDEIYGGTGQDRIAGGRGKDIIVGGDGRDVVRGGQDEDDIWGGNDDDDLSGEGGHDEIHGGPGNDIGRGDDGDDSVHGGAGDDDLSGDDGSDEIYGESGDDTIDGGNGVDDINGGGQGGDSCTGGDDSDGESVVGCGDGEAPKVQSFALEDDSVDASSADQEVTALLHVTDNSTGVGSLSVVMRSPDHMQLLRLGSMETVSGSTNSGVFRVRGTLPAHAASGEWTVGWIIAFDAIGNNKTWILDPVSEQADLALVSGYDSVLHQTGQAADTTGPVATDMLVESTTPNPVNGGERWRVTVHVTDDLSGVHGVYVRFRGASSEVETQMQLVSGSDDLYEGILAPAPSAYAGIWNFDGLFLYDEADNEHFYYNNTPETAGWQKTFTKLSGGDTAYPTLAGLTMTPTTGIDLRTNTATVTVTAHLTDAGGVPDSASWLFARLIAPGAGGSQVQGSLHRISGTAFDGEWQATITMPIQGVQGSWSLLLYTTDDAGNLHGYNQSALLAASLPDHVEVQYGNV